MAGFHKFDRFAGDVGTKTHDLVADTLKVYLTNVTPDAAAHAVKADLPEISAGNGYVAGGQDTQNGGSDVAGLLTVTAIDVIITASGGSIGPFQYAVLYNATATGEPLIGWWDRGSSVTLGDGAFQAIEFGGAVLTVT